VTELTKQYNVLANSTGAVVELAAMTALLYMLMSYPLSLVARRGYETKPSSRHVGVHDISYPIFGSDGRIRAALTIPFLSVIDGTQRADLEQARRMLADAAQKVSRGLGWIPPLS